MLGRIDITDDAGMTLTELFVVLSIMGIVLAAAYFLLATSSRIIDSLQARDAAVTQGNVAMDRLSREIRQAYEIVEDGGAVAVNQPRKCTFYVDLDHNRVPERVTYYVADEKVYRTVADATTAAAPFTFGADSAPQVIVENLKAGWAEPMFTYYDSAYPAAVVAESAPAQVAAVELHLVNQDTVGRFTGYCDLSTWVRLRTVHNSIH